MCVFATGLLVTKRTTFKREEKKIKKKGESKSGMELAAILIIGKSCRAGG